MATPTARNAAQARRSSVADEPPPPPPPSRPPPPPPPPPRVLPPEASTEVALSRRTSSSPHGISGQGPSRASSSSATEPSSRAARSIAAHSLLSHSAGAARRQSETDASPRHPLGSDISTASAAVKGRTSRPSLHGQSRRAQLTPTDPSSPAASSTIKLEAAGARASSAPHEATSLPVPGSDSRSSNSDSSPRPGATERAQIDPSRKQTIGRPASARPDAPTSSPHRIETCPSHFKGRRRTLEAKAPPVANGTRLCASSNGWQAVSKSGPPGAGSHAPPSTLSSMRTRCTCCRCLLRPCNTTPRTRASSPKSKTTHCWSSFLAALQACSESRALRAWPVPAASLRKTLEYTRRASGGFTSVTGAVGASERT
mmetsp:Transcript_38003/g.122957  ORF Transcript_38003/g.122957 Transcript_38003/m.122957 type:complete len:371 (+) Transcript_38003:3151-4263(+)